MRYAMGIEYDGSHYHGWQVQEGVATVQATLETAISRVADHGVRVICAGRTDTGVHALEQVIHFDSQANRTQRSWVFGSNANLPADITVLWTKQVDEDFHARFEAVRRAYRYIILNRVVRPALLNSGMTWDYRPLDVDKMQQAAEFLHGKHDFTSYRALECQAKSPVRTIYSLDISRTNDVIKIDIEANAFLHHMVRNIAGVLMAIGAGEKPVTWSKEVLEYRDRTLGGVTAPPSGLYLTGVTYPEKYNLPSREKGILD